MNKEYKINATSNESIKINKLLEQIELVQAGHWKNSQRVAKVGSWSTRYDREIPEWSDEMFYLFGFDPQSNPPLYSEFIKVVHPEQRATLDQKIKALLKDGENFSLELSIQLPTGVKRIINLTASVALKDANKVLVTYGTAQDVTEQKSAELALKESEHYLNKIINNIGDPVFVKDDQSRMVLANDAFCAAFGIPREHILGKTLAEDVPPNEREHFLKIDKQVLEDGQENSIEETLTVRNGQSKTIVTKKTRYIDERGNKFIVGVIRDISEIKKIEENLKLMIERFDLATRAAQLGVFDWNIINDDLVWDDQMYELYGLKKTGSTVKYDDWAQSIHPDDLKKASQDVDDAIRGEKDFESAFRVKYKDDSYRHIKAFANVFRDKNGVPVRMIGINYDITLQQRQEQLLARAERLESIGILAGGIAHDFNNLLAGMFGYIELAQRQIKDNKFELLSETLTKSLTMFNRAKDLSNQLLTFSKGGAPLVKSQSLIPVVSRSAEFSLSGSNIELHLQLEKDLWSVDIDENQIGQVIDNIVINAKQAMPGRGKIFISAKNVRLDETTTSGLTKGNYVCIRIQDNGTGISSEALEHIFDPFFSTKPQGSGIGLATVYSIIKKHNGQIDVQSELGVGTNFNIWLPASNKQERIQEIETNPEIKYQGKVLLMDDERDLLDILSSHLESIGCEVFSAVNSEAAIKLFKAAQNSKTPFELVILDLTIPGGEGGKEVAQKLRLIDPSVITIASSGYADDPIMANPHSYGFNDSITKPYTLNELVEVLSRYA